jgi:teichuronic acid biosynthesis glycosyltransferase TuaG
MDMQNSTETADPRVREPVVSVVIPTYNASRVIRRTLRSVANQTLSDFELILCDDGSMDETVAIAMEVLASSGCPALWRVLRLGGRGAAGTRNEGIQAARGEFVAFLDDDDHWEPRKLEACVEALRGGPYDMVCHAEAWVREGAPAQSQRVRVYSDLYDERLPPIVSVMRNNPFSTSAVVVRKDRLIEAGPFDETLPSAEDLDLWIRLITLPDFRVSFIDEPLGEYTLRHGSESSKVEHRYAALTTIGGRYRAALVGATRSGPLEFWVYRARVELTTGLRFIANGEFWRGVWMAGKGVLMWPFRLDWIRIWWRGRTFSQR